jgi:riboflavin biosynthesis pyrimidine reductase
MIIAGDSSVDLRGPHLFGALLAADRVDEMCVTVSPLLAGPGAGRMVAGPPIAEPAGLRLAHVLEEDGALFTRYVADRVAGAPAAQGSG